MNTKKTIAILCIGASLLLPGCGYFKKAPAVTPKSEPAAEAMPSQLPEVEKPAEVPAPVPPVVEEAQKPEVEGVKPDSEGKTEVEATKVDEGKTEVLPPKVEEGLLAPKAQAPKIQLVGPVPFKSCGQPSQFTSQKWYADLDAQLKLEDKLDADGAKDAPGNQGKLSAGALGQICYSDAGSLILGYYGGGKCLRGMVFRYSITQKILEKATFATVSDKCSASFAGFGKRTGSVIPIKALNISVGSAKTINYDYNFVANTLTAK